MIWKYYALSQMGKEYRGVFTGDRQGLGEHVEHQGLKLISQTPDYIEYMRTVLIFKGIPDDELSRFFDYFARMNEGGFTASETFTTLSMTTGSQTLQEALKNINVRLAAGESIQASFAKTGVFPSIVVASLAAAERSGNLPEVLRALDNYYKFRADMRAQILSALAYPCLVILALTVASIVISTKLIPQLKSLLPQTALASIPTKMLLGYAWAVQHYWGLLLIMPIVLFLISKQLWREYGDKIMVWVYKIPRIGDLVKEMEFATIFLCLSVYLKSGVVITKALNEIYEAHPTYITKRLVLIKQHLFSGMSFWQAIAADNFFPPFIHTTIRKGEDLGQIKESTYEIYRFYGSNIKRTLSMAVEMLNPILLMVILAMVAFLIFAFFVPLYSGFGNMADQIYK